MSRVPVIDESEFVRSILAQWELAARLAARDAIANARTDKDHLAWKGYPIEGRPGQPSTKEEIAAIIERTDTIIENGEVMARAWLRIRTHILAALVAEGGEQIYEQGEVPPTKRQPRADERDPIQLPPVDVIECEARAHGIFSEESNEPKNET